jgi:hypothetical protein
MGVVRCSLLPGGWRRSYSSAEWVSDTETRGENEIDFRTEEEEEMEEEGER